MRYYEPPEDLAGTVFDPADETFGPIMAALQAGDFDAAASLTAKLAGRPGVTVLDAWDTIYQHAIPDPDEYEDDHVPLAEHEKFEAALKAMHGYMRPSE